MLRTCFVPIDVNMDFIHAMYSLIFPFQEVILILKDLLHNYKRVNHPKQKYIFKETQGLTLPNV